MSAAGEGPGGVDRATDGGEVVEATTRIAYAVRMLANSLGQQIDQALRPLQLTQAQLAALAQLAFSEHGWLSGAELGRRAGVTAQAMSASLPALVERGLVDRAPHLTHGRVIRVWITPEGRRLLARAQSLTAAVDARAMAVLAPDEQRQLRSLLLRVMAGSGLHVPAGSETEETG